MSIDVACPLPHNWKKNYVEYNFLPPTFLRDIFGFCILSPQINFFENNCLVKFIRMKEF